MITYLRDGTLGSGVACGYRSLWDETSHGASPSRPSVFLGLRTGTRVRDPGRPRSPVCSD